MNERDPRNADDDIIDEPEISRTPDEDVVGSSSDDEFEDVDTINESDESDEDLDDLEE